MAVRAFAPVALLLLCPLVSAVELATCANGKCDEDDYTSFIQLKQNIEVANLGLSTPEGPINSSGDTMTTGKDWTCARSASYIACWGENDYGQLGLNNFVTTSMASGASAFIPFPNIQAVAGAFHICGIYSGILSDGSVDNDAGQVKCWGKNDKGQLGYQNAQNLKTLPNVYVNLGTGLSAKQLAAGDEHTCAILNDNQVKCWGRGDLGQLGTENNQTRGTHQYHMGDYLVKLSLGAGKTAVQLAAGRQHTCALLNNAQVKCWGANTYGQLGLNLASATSKSRGGQINQMGDSLPEVALGTIPGAGGRFAKAIFAGGDHTCVILTTHRVKCWGRNDLGQLGYGNSASDPDIGTAQGEMGDALHLVDLGNKTGTGDSLVPFSVKTMALGYFHTCAVMGDSSGKIDRLKCWGNNDKGQLGYGDVATLGDESGEMGNELETVSLGQNRYAVNMSAGSNHTCAILDNNDMKCWGSNNKGQLGNGVAGTDTNATIGDSENEMGGYLPQITAQTTTAAPTPAPTPPPTPEPTTTTAAPAAAAPAVTTTAAP